MKFEERTAQAIPLEIGKEVFTYDADGKCGVVRLVSRKWWTYVVLFFLPFLSGKVIEFCVTHGFEWEDVHG